MFEAYWASERDEDSELWRKIKPMPSSHGWLVVRTFRTGEDGKPDNVKPLPYDLVPASESLDLWSVGILAYLLCAAKPLVSSTRDDDFESGNAMSVIATWGREKMKKKLQAVPDDVARDLIQTLLQPDPSDRRTVDDALKHPFFHPESGGGGGRGDQLATIIRNQEKEMAYLDKIDKCTMKIEGLQLLTMAKMTEHATNLRLCIQAAADDTVPTAFLIVPAPPEPSALDEIMEAGKAVAGDARALSGKPNARCVNRRQASMMTVTPQWLSRPFLIGHVISRRVNRTLASTMTVTPQWLSRPFLMRHVISRRVNRTQASTMTVTPQWLTRPFLMRHIISRHVNRLQASMMTVTPQWLTRPFLVRHIISRHVNRLQASMTTVTPQWLSRPFLMRHVISRRVNRLQASMMALYDQTSGVLSDVGAAVADPTGGI